MQVCTETVNFALEVITTIQEEQILLQNSLHLSHLPELGQAVSGPALQSTQLWEGKGGLAEIVKLVRE